MAASYLAAPGTEAGPCAKSCQHIDCALTRAMAKAPCFYCKEAIGYETGFFSQVETVLRDKDDKIYAHSKCYQEILGK